jgi:prepilin-type N-terminal cleavage/methylation domain-containing protein
LTRPLQNSQGFTLLEILIVTLIIGVLAEVMAMNMISYMPQRRLSGATRQLTWDLMGARMKAIKLRKNVVVVFVGDHTYTVWTDTNKNGVVDTGEEEVKNIHTNYHDVNITSTSNTTFGSRGTCNNMATITLTNSSGSKTITVNVAGFVKAS